MNRWLLILIIPALLGCGEETIRQSKINSGDGNIVTVNGKVHVSVHVSNVLLRYYNLVPCSEAIGEYKKICADADGGGKIKNKGQTHE